MNLYKIIDKKETICYLKYFYDNCDCKHFVINTLDVSLDWTYDKVDFSVDIIVVNKDKYWEMLEVLPPLRMFEVKEVEGFLMSEYETGCITSCYCSYKNSYYHLFVKNSDSSEKIANRVVSAHLNKKNLIKGG